MCRGPTMPRFPPTSWGRWGATLGMCGRLWRVGHLGRGPLRRPGRARRTLSRRRFGSEAGGRRRRSPRVILQRYYRDDRVMLRSAWNRGRPFRKGTRWSKGIGRGSIRCERGRRCGATLRGTGSRSATSTPGAYPDANAIIEDGPMVGHVSWRQFAYSSNSNGCRCDMVRFGMPGSRSRCELSGV